jgi:hypothetical protein
MLWKKSVSPAFNFCTSANWQLAIGTRQPTNRAMVAGRYCQFHHKCLNRRYLSQLNGFFAVFDGIYNWQPGTQRSASDSSPSDCLANLGRAISHNKPLLNPSYTNRILNTRGILGVYEGFRTGYIWDAAMIWKALVLVLPSSANYSTGSSEEPLYGSATVPPPDTRKAPQPWESQLKFHVIRHLRKNPPLFAAFGSVAMLAPTAPCHPHLSPVLPL